jgi:hypothetical protein
VAKFTTNGAFFITSTVVFLIHNKQILELFRVGVHSFYLGSLLLSTRESREDVKDMSRGPVHIPPIVPLLFIYAVGPLTVVWFLNVEYIFVLVQSWYS